MSDPIYSSDPAEECRMLLIRDTPNDRVKAVARSRAKCGAIVTPFNDTELIWIMEDERQYRTATPHLEPQEYWSMIRGLAAELRRARDLAKINRHSTGT